MAVIYITEADKTRHKYRLPTDPAQPVTIGRSGDCMVSLPQVVGLSGRHCSIFLQEGAYIIRDDGSTNGTYADKHAIGAEPLQAGTAYRIGEAVLTYDPELPAAGHPAGPAPAPARARARSGRPSPKVAAPRAGKAKSAAGTIMLALILMALAYYGGLALRCWVDGCPVPMPFG